ncbi:MAG: CNNM domain-containing protein, partial [Phycisphaerae bacterium]|nr:CNNM domain-containing protein [Phycisphaerae bacterium]
MSAGVWSMIGALCASLLSLLFSTLTYSLRDFSRARLSDALAKRGMAHWLEPICQRANDLIVTTAIGRLLANLLILIFILEVSYNPQWSRWVHYLAAVTATSVIGMFCSVAIPHALARHAGETIIASHARFLWSWRAVLAPLTRLMDLIDALIGRLAGMTPSPDGQEKVAEI